MQNSSSLSTNKIIILIVFLCAAIMTSLFVFHLSHKNPPSALSPDQGIIFSVARDIKPFQLISSTNSAFTEKNFRHHWTLLFFGFTHCASICPTTLAMMNRAYSQLHSTYPDLQFVFISLDPERDTISSLVNYAHSFNQHFIAATGQIQEIHQLQSQLGIFSAQDTSASTTNYQLIHTASILLINPEGKWVGLFKFGMNPQQFAQAFHLSITSLTKNKTINE